MKDSVTRSIVVLSLLGAAGFLGLIVAAVAMNRYDGVADQLPYAVSGVMGGLGMLGFCIGIIVIQMGRRAAATERRAFDTLLRASAQWLADARAEGTPR